ncbi:MAG: beta-ketoacyl-ACP synthase II [Syntrophomonadaceae bacterium]|nr:beta-ketoacyl-ACP synthase II [Syntrophomonadaceae bacterium]
MKKRVVITGIGILAPNGTGKEVFWQALTEGKSGIGTVTRFKTDDFPTKIAGEVRDFDPGKFFDRKEAKRMDRFTQFAVAGTKLAIEDAGLNLESIDSERLAVVFGTGIGGMETLEEQARILAEKGPGRVSPFFVPMMIANMAAGQISISIGAKGPNYTIVNACATGTNAVGDAYKLLQRGEADAVITGGSEASVTPLAFAGFCSMKAMSTRNNEPDRASRPFDRDRDGFVLSEGAGVLLLETLEHAKSRGAHIYTEVIGYGSSADAFHITAPVPGGEGAAASMQAALNDAKLKPEEVEYINAHGTSTDLNDKLETLAIKKVFGAKAYDIPISSTKSMTGHLLGAAGAIELIACCMAIEKGIIPPTINYETPDPDCDLDYVPNKARRQQVAVALSNSFGFGGHNATVILKKYNQVN